jgi:DNA/RNA-binding protein KIN17
MYDGKGIYKLKYFCQICDKQCRDKDGFNCHIKSSTHKKNLEIVSQNPDQFINKFSSDFESTFLDILKRNYSNIYISANKVYQEYIEDKDSIHLNATKWATLSAFIKHLHSIGKIHIQATEKETKIKYIDITPDNYREKEMQEKKQKDEIYLQRKREKEFEKYNKLVEKKPIENDEVDVNKLKDISIEIKKTEVLNLKIENNIRIPKRNSDKFNSAEPWIAEGLIVKIKDNELNQLYDKKGKIIKLINEYFAEVEVDNLIIKIDQEFLKPIIPPLGLKVMILYGKDKHKVGILEEIDLKNKIANIKTDQILTLDIRGICKYLI